MRGRLVTMAACSAVILGLTVLANEKPSPQYQQAMKDISEANTALRTTVTAKDYAAIEKDAAKIKTAFAVVEAFWVSKKMEPAVKLAQDGGKAAGDLESGAKAKNDDNIAAAQKAVGATCMPCHQAHRERLPDGSSEIK